MKFVAVVIVTLVLGASVQAQVYATSPIYSGGGGGSTCGNCMALLNEDTYVTKVVGWAVALQLRNWLSKKPDELSREEVKAASAKLEVLKKWAKEDVQNKVFAVAYLQWVSEMSRQLDNASSRLDRDEVASTLLLHGLPALPEGAR